MLHNTRQRTVPGREPECGMVLRMKKQYNKTPHYIKIEKSSEENIIPARKAKNTGENLYKNSMYLNQFTNTKELWYARVPVHDQTHTVDICYWCVRCGGVREGGGRIPSIFFFFYKMTQFILFHTLSASKMSSTRYYYTKKCHSSTKNCFPVPKLYSISTFAELFTGFKYIHPLLSIESHQIQVTRDHKKTKTYYFIQSYQSNASITPQSKFSSGCIGMKEDLLYIYIYSQHIYRILFINCNGFISIINK